MNKLNDVNATIVIDSTLVPGADVEQRIRDCILIYAEEVIKMKSEIKEKYITLHKQTLNTISIVTVRDDDGSLSDIEKKAKGLMKGLVE